MVSLLSCSINGVDITIAPNPGTLLASLHDDAPSIIEHTTCNYGLNTDLDRIASEHGMRVGATDEFDEIRAVELIDHPFFVATLYQPQLKSSRRRPHPVFMGFMATLAGTVDR